MATIYVQDVVVSEADGFVDLVFKLDAPATSAVSVNYATSNGTATYVSSSDYTAKSGTVNFAVGEQTQTVSIFIGAGTVLESLESFYVGLSGAVNATIGNTSALVSIVDNDSIVDTPGLSVRDVVVDERAGTATFTVVLGWPHGQASNGTVSVDFATTDGTATAPGDYVATSGTLTFAAGVTVETVTVDINNDSTAEKVEHFGFDLSNAAGATITDGHAEAIIGASDAADTALPRVSVSDAVVGESDGYVDFVVTLSAPGQNAVTVKYATANGTATYVSASDYLARSGTLSFAPGETTKTVRVQLGDNTTAENLETLYLNLTAPANATIAKPWGRVNIVDDDTLVDTPTLFVRDTVVDEKAGTASFVVMLGGPTGQASNSPVSFHYATANGTAVSGSDYAATAGDLTFAPGETVKTITVDIADDTAVEKFERFGLNLSSVVGATLLDGHADAVIGASDATAVAQPRISVSDGVVSESDGYVDFVITLSAPGQNEIRLAASTANGTATYVSASDYLAVGSSYLVTFSPGETTKTVRVQLGDDATAENLQTFYLNLSQFGSPPLNATIAKPWGVVNIVDDDTLVDTPTLFARDAVVDEKAGTASFVVMLGGPRGQTANGPVSVDYATGNGTARSGSDYTAGSGRLTFAPGETVKTITVDIADDTAAEALERVNLRLSGAVGATIIDGRAVAEIGANDNAAVVLPHLTIDNTTVAEGDGYANVVVRLTTPGTGVVTVNVATSNGTASYVSASDYLAYSSPLTFAPGETTKVVRVQLGDGTAVENLETFNVNLSGAVGAVIDKPAAVVAIVDNDSVGIDVFSHGRSDDVYTVDQSTDRVVENLAGGTDLVNSSASYVLPENTENLSLTGSSAINGTGNALANVLTGNSAANNLQGLAGNDTIDGRGGNDTMNGGTGNDTYFVGSAGDSVVESPGAGKDTVQSTRTTTLAVNVEKLVLSGPSAINGTGNASANQVTGNSAANRLNGVGGDDTLIGGAGNDTLTGGAGSDTFVLGSLVGADRVDGFSSPSDTILVSQAGIRVGDGDSVVDGAATRSAPGGFAASAELVLFTADVSGSLTAAAAAAQIGSANSAYTTGADRIFVVDNGTLSGVFLFQSSGADASVSAGELTLLAILDAPSTLVADYLFGP